MTWNRILGYDEFQPGFQHFLFCYHKTFSALFCATVSPLRNRMVFERGTWNKTLVYLHLLLCYKSLDDGHKSRGLKKEKEKKSANAVYRPVASSYPCLMVLLPLILGNCSPIKLHTWLFEILTHTAKKDSGKQEKLSRENRRVQYPSLRPLRFHIAVYF